MSNNAKLKKYEDVLMTALQFRESDLAANEAGELSPTQIRKLQWRRSMAIIGALVLTAIFAFILLSFVRFAAFRGASPLLAIGFVIVVGILAFITYQAVSLTNDLRDGVSVVEGRVQLDMNRGEQTSRFYVKIDNIRFRVRKAVFLAFKNGDPYRIYYAPRSKLILSVEWLRDDDPFIGDDGEVMYGGSGETETVRRNLDDGAEVRRGRSRGE
jgi:hypothetical protein